MHQRQTSNLCSRALRAEQQSSGFYDQILPIYIGGFAGGYTATSACLCICRALGASRIDETHKKRFPGCYVFVVTRIYFITIAFCSCERDAEKIRG